MITGSGVFRWIRSARHCRCSSPDLIPCGRPKAPVPATYFGRRGVPSHNHQKNLVGAYKACLRRNEAALCALTGSRRPPAPLLPTVIARLTLADRPRSYRDIWCQNATVGRCVAERRPARRPSAPSPARAPKPRLAGRPPGPSRPKLTVERGQMRDPHAPTSAHGSPENSYLCMTPISGPRGHWPLTHRVHAVLLKGATSLPTTGVSKAAAGPTPPCGRDGFVVVVGRTRSRRCSKMPPTLVVMAELFKDAPHTGGHG